MLALVRRHDEMLKAARQDLFRAETQLAVERAWRWPIRAGCVTLGALGLAAWQNDDIRGGLVAFTDSLFTHIRHSGVETLVAVVAGAAAILALAFLIQRWLRGPTPERQASKLMADFARADGVAAYVFTSQDTPEEEAATIGALASSKHKRMRQRRLTDNNRPLASSVTRILNQQLEGSDDLRRHMRPDAAPAMVSERA